MPELPEVETVRQGLSKWIVGKTVRLVRVYYPRIVEQRNEFEVNSRLSNQPVHEIRRRGKYLMIHIGAEALISHLRMEGRFYLFEQVSDQTSPIAWSQFEPAFTKHIHFALFFTDGTTLIYHDTRKFGRFKLVPWDAWEEERWYQSLGFEPFDDLPNDYLYKRLHGRHITLKQALLDQRVLLGLGNIYADETCFDAKLHPLTKTSRLSRKDCEALLVSSQKVLRQALKAGGTTIRTFEGHHYFDGYFDNHLAVYGRTDEPCEVCGQPIRKIFVASRGTHFCSNCQRRK